MLAEENVDFLESVLDLLWQVVGVLLLHFLLVSYLIHVHLLYYMPVLLLLREKSVLLEAAFSNPLIPLVVLSSEVEGKPKTRGYLACYQLIVVLLSKYWDFISIYRSFAVGVLLQEMVAGEKPNDSASHNGSFSFLDCR